MKALFFGLFALSCRTPTEIDVSVVGRGLACEEGAPFAHYESGVLVRERFTNRRDVNAAQGTGRSYASSRSCAGRSDPELTDLGSSVVVPTDLPERVEILAVAGFDRDPNDEVAPPSVLRCLEFFDPEKAECPEDQPACRSCIFATRSLAFLEFSSLKLSVELDTRCAGIICPEGETCFQGECESNVVSCEGSGCSIPGELGGGGAGGAGGAGIWLTTELEGGDEEAPIDLTGVTSDDGAGTQIFAAHGALSRITIDPGEAPALIVDDALGEFVGEPDLLTTPTHVGAPVGGAARSDVFFARIKTGNVVDEIASCGFGEAPNDGPVCQDVATQVACEAPHLTGFSGRARFFSVEAEGCPSYVQQKGTLISRDVGPTGGVEAAAFASTSVGGIISEVALWTRAGDLSGRAALWVGDREVVPSLGLGRVDFIDPIAAPLLSATAVVPAFPDATVRLFAPGQGAMGGLRLNALDLTDEGRPVFAQAIPTGFAAIWGITSNTLGDVFVLGRTQDERVAILRLSAGGSVKLPIWTRCEVPLDTSIAEALATATFPVGVDPIWADEHVVALAYGKTVALLPEFNSQIVTSDCTEVTDVMTREPSNPFSALDNVWRTVEVPGDTIDIVGMQVDDNTAVLHIANGGNLMSLTVTSPQGDAPPNVEVLPLGPIAKAVGAVALSNSPSDLTVARHRNERIEVCDRVGTCESSEPQPGCLAPFRIRVAGGSLDTYGLDFEGVGAPNCAWLQNNPSPSNSNGFTHPELAGISVSNAGSGVGAPAPSVFAAYNRGGGGTYYLYGDERSTPMLAARAPFVSFPLEGGGDQTIAVDPSGNLLVETVPPNASPTGFSVSINLNPVYALASTHVGIANSVETFALGRNVGGGGVVVGRIGGAGAGQLPQGTLPSSLESLEELVIPSDAVGKLLWVSEQWIAVAWPNTGAKGGWHVAIRRRP